MVMWSTTHSLFRFCVCVILCIVSIRAKLQTHTRKTTILLDQLQKTIFESYHMYRGGGGVLLFKLFA